MLYPVGDRQLQYLVIDPESPLDLEDVTIPYLPNTQETNEQWHFGSCSIYNRRYADGLFKIAGRNPRWTYQSRDLSHYALLDVLRKVEYEKHLRDFYLNVDQ